MRLYLPFVCLFTAMATVGSYVALSKPLLASIPVFILAFIRFSIAGVFMLTWLRNKPQATKLRPNEKWYLFIQSFLGNFLFSICMLFGVSYSGAVIAGIVMSAIPAAVAMLSFVLLKEQISSRTKLAIFISCLAVACLSMTQANQAPSTHSQMGLWLLIGAVFCEAAYVVLAKRLSNVLDPKRNSALLNAWGWLLMLPLCVWQFYDTGFNLDGITLDNWLLLVYYAIAASMLSTWLWFTGLKTVPANKAGVYTVALPLTAALFGVFVFHEPFTIWHAAAFLLATASVILATTPATKSVST